MNWYAMAWKKYGEFEGRSRRTEYWMFMLFNFLAMIALGILGGIGLAISEHYGGLLFIPLGVYFLITIIPSLAISVRRLHDTGKSGWMLLLFAVLGFIPLVGLVSSIIQLVFLCQDSDPGTNQYGPNPKFPDQPGAFAGNMGYLSMEFSAQPQPITVESQTHQTPTDPQ